MSVAIRPAVSADLDEVACIWFDGWARPVWEPPLMTTCAGGSIGSWQANGRFFVATVDAAIVGMLALKPAVLDQLFVAPAFQRRGIGVALLREAQRRLPTGFVLRTGVKNIGARRFYEREGLILERIDLHPTSNTHVAYYRWEPAAA